MNSDAESRTLRALRGILMFILVTGIIGLILELLLLGHYDGAWQLAPLALLGAGLLILVWYAISRGGTSLRALQMLMGLFILSGLAGVILHYRGNVEFEAELNPAAHGLRLIGAAASGATPTLAPGAMLQLGLIGLVYCFRHPRLLERSQSRDS
jgi:hypothetical protein